MRKQNPGGVVVKLSPNEELPSGVRPRFNKPKHGGVIPAKRRSVKRMMFNQFVQSIAHLFRARSQANSSSSSNKTN
uniref:Uncharacterized protein n=1 Tax=Fagus sylvatica TaxID=28930 RepID=A0A2N9H7Z1_FAGSY